MAVALIVVSLGLDLHALPLVSELHPSRILIKPKADASVESLRNFHESRLSTVSATFPALRGIQVIELPAGEDLQSAISAYENSGLVEYAEPDFVRHLAVAPNDPKFLDGTLWALNNSGQNGGTAKADIDATEAWDLFTSASNIIVAVLDTGVCLTHEDLAANLWTNPNDGGHGLNALAGTNTPLDDECAQTPQPGHSP